jgi:uncharacterized membrane protein (UPF0136 family)
MKFLPTVLIVYGIINIVGGVVGFAMAGSPASLIAGGTAGVLIVLCGVAAKNKPALAYRSAAILTLILLGFWVFRIVELNNEGRSIMMALGNTILAIMVFGLLGYGHFAAQKRRVAGQNSEKHS